MHTFMMLYSIRDYVNTLEVGYGSQYTRLTFNGDLSDINIA